MAEHHGAEAARHDGATTWGSHGSQIAIGETAILLHSPSPFRRCFNRGATRGMQQNDRTLADGCSQRRSRGGAEAARQPVGQRWCGPGRSMQPAMWSNARFSLSSTMKCSILCWCGGSTCVPGGRGRGEGVMVDHINAPPKVAVARQSFC